MNTATNPITTHECATQTNQDFSIKFHNGPELLVSGNVLHSTDNFKLIACPAHNKFFGLSYNRSNKAVDTKSGKNVFDLAEYPSEIQNKAFLNISLKIQNNPEFDEDELNSFSLFEDRLADHLAWISNEEHQDSENDATIFFDGEILTTTQLKNTLICGAHCNLEKSNVLVKLNPSEDFPEQYGLFCITYYVPSKHINDVKNFDMPEPSLTYYTFNDCETAKKQIVELENKENLMVEELVSKL